MFLREDAEVTLITTEDGQPHVSPALAGMLEAGDRIAVLPGSERGGLLAELMAAWDENLALVKERYLPMYHEALWRSEHNCGGAAGLAHRIGVHPSTVSTWLRGHNRPQQPAHLRRLLELSGHEPATRNQAVIAEYFSRTRGAHRLIGRVLNDCVQETVVYGAAGGENIDKLRELVGTDLTDLFDDVHVLRVAYVSAPHDGVPAGVCGSFLDPDDPYLKQKGALS
jgi:DNA-binding transcriptional regulator YdaS (Cro superfamily)